MDALQFRCVSYGGARASSHSEVTRTPLALPSGAMSQAGVTGGAVSIRGSEGEARRVATMRAPTIPPIDPLRTLDRGMPDTGPPIVANEPVGASTVKKRSMPLLLAIPAQARTD